MRAVQISTTGPSSVLELVSDKAIPVVGPTDVLVRNKFAGVNYIDVYHRSGAFPGSSNILGLEGAGEIAAVGSEVTSLRVGDRVAWPMTSESYAEYVKIPHDRVVRVPAGLDLQVACAAMMQGLTAHTLAVDGSYNIKPGDWALVHAVSGGVGLLLTQLIKLRGGHVIGTCSSEAKAQLAYEYGADHVIVGYHDVAAKCRELTGGKGVHVVYDSVGKDTFQASLDSLRPRGAFVLFGTASGDIDRFDTFQELYFRGAITFSRPGFQFFVEAAEDLQWRAKDLLDSIEQGKIKVLIGGVYPIARVRDCHDDLEGRKSTGKLVLEL